MALLYPGGTTTLGSYKITARHPFDVREIAVKFEDLLDLETFSNNVYEGLRVLVSEEMCVYELVPATQENRGGKIALQFDRSNLANNKKLWKRLTIETITTKEALQRAKDNLVNGALIYVVNDVYEGEVYEIESVFSNSVPISEYELDDISNAKIGYFSNEDKKGFYYYTNDGTYYIVTQKGLAKVFVAPDTDPTFIASDGSKYKYTSDYGDLEPYVDAMPSMVKKGLYFCQNVNGEGRLTMAGGGGDAVDRLNKILDASIAKLSIDTTNRQLKATSSDNKNFFVAMTELIKPASPSIATTEYAVVTGNADVTITNNQTGATLKYSTDGTSWINVSNDKVSLASEFETTKDNSTKTYTLRVKAVLNGVESDVVTKTITINPKVSAPALAVSRTPNDNDWATMATITMTASSYKGATSKYSDDGGDSWYEFTGTKTFTTTANATASKYQVKAERTGYIGSDTLESTAITLNKKKFYYGRGPATLSSESYIKSLVGGGSIEKSTMAGSYSIKSTEMGQYTWFCGTGTLSNVTSGGFLVPFNSVQVIDGYNCYRSSSPVQNLDSDTFVVS